MFDPVETRSLYTASKKTNTHILSLSKDTSEQSLEKVTNNLYKLFLIGFLAFSKYK